MNARIQTVTDAYERFLAFERRTGIGSRSVCGVRVWPLIRVDVFNRHMLPLVAPMSSPHPDMRLEKHGQPKGWIARLHSWWWRLRYGIPLFPRHYDVLFSLTPRQIKLPDGRELAQNLDFFLPKFTGTYAVLEWRYGNAAYPRRAWPRIFHLDGYLGRFRSFRRRSGGDGEEIRRFAVECCRELDADFGIRPDPDALSRKAGGALAYYQFFMPLFRQWIRRLGLKCVVTVVHYSTRNQVLCAAARAEGVPVVELQHGTIVPTHAAYNLTAPDADYSPDYLFAWGRIWVENTRNYALRKCVCVGFPLLEWMMRRYPPVRGSGPRRIVFLSQGTIGAELSRRAVELAAVLPSDRFTVQYKLHPNESKSWRSLYPWLQDGKVEIVPGGDRSVYDMFGEASAVVGVYSTALIEALMWGIRTYVFTDIPGTDFMRPFLGRGLLVGVGSASDLCTCLTGEGDGSVSEKIDASLFWENQSASRIASELQKVVKEVR